MAISGCCKKHCAMIDRLTVFLIAATLLGCSTAPKYPAPQGTQVAHKELKELFNGAVVHGRFHGTNDKYIQRHYVGGGYTFARKEDLDAQDYDYDAAGTWRISGDQVCYEVKPENKLTGCHIVYENNGQLEFLKPLTGEPWSLSYKIEYDKTAIPPAAATPPPPDPDPPLPPATAAAPAQPPMRLKPVSSGSGFIVNSQTFVLTNDHVIDECVEVTVRLDDREVRAAIRARDRRNDLALLRLPAGDYPVAVFQGNNTLYPGDSVVAIGYPLSDILASEGNVSLGIVSALAGLGNRTNHLQISNPIQPGNSGGPLFDISGHVVGIVVSGLSESFALEAFGSLPQNVNFAIKSSVAEAFMQASSVEYMVRESARELRPADVARKGRPATVQVHCWS